MTTARFEGTGQRVPFIAGFLASLAAVLLIGEAYARFSPPRDIRQQFGQNPTQERLYKPDPELGADFRSYDDFRALNAAWLRQLGPLDLAKPTWLLFGNSFVQGPGHVADTATQMLPELRIFALRLHIDLPLRAAEARQLLSHGLKPRRIFFVMLPVDLLQIGKRPLSFIEVNAEGAITTRLRWPDAPWTWAVTASRLATIAWIRSGRAAGDPSFDPRRVTATPSPRVQRDLLRIFNHLAETSRRYDVPVTVVALPGREQVFGRTGFGFQETLAELTRRAGLDFHDARRPFIEAADKISLFVPDWHFSARGNALAVRELVALDKARAGEAAQRP
jgi:hypothetical protein